MTDHILLKYGLRVVGAALYVKSNTKPVGVLNPGFLLAETLNELIIVGPQRTVKARKNAYSILAALVKSRSLIKGSPAATEIVCRFLSKGDTSRTTSYLLNYADSLDQIVRFFKRASVISIAIVGCGGIGSNSAILLAGMGFKRLKLIDNDRVELSNLNRQTLFSKSDIGKNKVDVIGTRLRERFSNIRIKKVKKFLKKETILEKTRSDSIVLLSADNPPSLFSYLQSRWHNGKPLIAAGYSMGVGKVFFVTKRNEFEFDNLDWQNLELDIPSSTGPLNYEVASQAVTLITRYLLNGNSNTISYEWDSFSFPRKEIKW